MKESDVAIKEEVFKRIAHEYGKELLIPEERINYLISVYKIPEGKRIEKTAEPERAITEEAPEVANKIPDQIPVGSPTPKSRRKRQVTEQYISTKTNTGAIQYIKSKLQEWGWK